MLQGLVPNKLTGTFVSWLFQDEPCNLAVTDGSLEVRLEFKLGIDPPWASMTPLEGRVEVAVKDEGMGMGLELGHGTEAVSSVIGGKLLECCTAVRGFSGMQLVNFKLLEMQLRSLGLGNIKGGGEAECSSLCAL